VTFINDGRPKSGQVSISQTAAREVIHVADKSTWMVDLSDGGCDFDATGMGFIEKESTKFAIYVCYQNCIRQLSTIFMHTRPDLEMKNMCSHFPLIWECDPWMYGRCLRRNISFLLSVTHSRRSSMSLLNNPMPLQSVSTLLLYQCNDICSFYLVSILFQL
jgi:hypothetical protein